jgi:hypothetical protein
MGVGCKRNDMISTSGKAIIFQFIRRSGCFVAIEVASLFCRCSIMGMIALESASVFSFTGLKYGFRTVSWLVKAGEIF